MDELDRVGVDHWRGTRVEFERRGKARTAEAYEYPALHNYIWLCPTPRQVHLLSGVQHLGRTFHFMGPHAVAEFGRFRQRVDDREAEARKLIAAQKEEMRIAQDMAKAAANRKEELIAKRALIKASMREYQAGEMIQIRDGVLAGEMAKFRRLVLGAEDVHPFIEAEMSVMGRVATIKVDPLAVRRASIC